MDISNLGAGINDPFVGLGLDDPVNEEKKSKKKKNKEDSGDNELAGGKKDLVHLRVQQRNGRKCITTVQGLDQQLDLKKILKALKKQECCNGTVVEDDDMGQVLQFQGDQRDAVFKFLTENRVPPPARSIAHMPCRTPSTHSGCPLQCAWSLACEIGCDDVVRCASLPAAEIVESSSIKKHGARPAYQAASHTHVASAYRQRTAHRRRPGTLRAPSPFALSPPTLAV